VGVKVLFRFVVLVVVLSFSFLCSALLSEVNGDQEKVFSAFPYPYPCRLTNKSIFNQERVKVSGLWNQPPALSRIQRSINH